MTFLVGAAAALQPATAAAAVWYVDADATGADSGATWTDAFADLQGALAAAVSGDEVWVAEGLYVPSVELDVDGSGGANPREATFALPSGVQLYGGFAGGEASLAERDPAAHPTILSGDLGGDDADLDGDHIAETPADIAGANAYHVVVTESAAPGTRLDGFVVTAGDATDGSLGTFSPNLDGGGLFNREGPAPDVSRPTIAGCRFVGNRAGSAGGAMHLGSFTPGDYAATIVGSSFSGNEARRSGGAIYLLGDTSTIESSTFENNATTIVSPAMDTSPGSGGAIYFIASNAVVRGSYFIGNSATGNPTGAFEGGGGGAVYVNHSTSVTDSIGASLVRFENVGFYDNTTGGNGSGWGGAANLKSDGGNLRVEFVGCVFSGNSADGDGGAVSAFARTLTAPAVLDPILEPSFTNVTFTGNSATEEGGAVYLDGFIFSATEMLTAAIDNSLLSGNSAGISGPEIVQTGDTTFRSSLVAGSGGSAAWDAVLGTDGGGNLDAPPGFVNPANPLGPDAVPGTSDDGLALAAGSAAIDAADPAAPGLLGITLDYAGEARLTGSAPDIGAYEAASAGPVCGALPGVLQAVDVGNTGGFSGSTCFSAGTYEVEASGSGLWFAQDGFHFVEQAGAFSEVVARVDDLSGASPFDLAGIMMRGSLDPASAHAALVLSEAGAITLRFRRFDGFFTSFRFGGLTPGPVWLRLRRWGPFVRGAWSSDGATWHRVATVVAFLPPAVRAGLVTSALVPGTVATAELSELSYH